MIKKKVGVTVWDGDKYKRYAFTPSKIRSVHDQVEFMFPGKRVQWGFMSDDQIEEILSENDQQTDSLDCQLKLC